ncbi:hypothetical protein BJY01DRAFT_100171 [Aspergillus pseudoustus]|uniref:Uncharacterized protein n=1 Tax=Aspergillus pseudoustus TaxID=1810923 RepID=A0ABR4IY41_9EURO
MSVDTLDDAARRAPLEVVVPTHGRRSWPGWVMLTDGETNEPKRGVGDSRILPDQILPTDQKRTRRRNDKFGFNYETSSTAGGNDIVPSARSSQELRPHVLPRGRRQRTRSDTQSEVEIKRKVRRLKIENDLRALAESHENQQLKAEVKRLQSLKAELNRMVDRLTSDAAPLDPARISNVNEDLLRRKEDIIERQTCMIRDLESSLSKTFEHETLRFKSQDEDLHVSAAGVENFMNSLRLGIIRTADLLSTCLYPPHPMLRALQGNPELRGRFESIVKDNKVLQSTPEAALRAVLFCIIRDHIMFSEAWTMLHAEGYMLRAYQRALQQTAGLEFFETFHKAALLEMVRHDTDFEACFLGAEAEELQLHTMDLLNPLLDPTKLEANQKDLIRSMNQLFSQSLLFRAQCLPPKGIRYEVVHFEPGEPFNSDLMEAQDVTGNRVSSPPSGSKCSIKLCVHGIVVAHKARETSTQDGLQKLKALSQPFFSSRTRSRNSETDGELISGKAIVMID